MTTRAKHPPQRRNQSPALRADRIREIASQTDMNLYELGEYFDIDLVVCHTALRSGPIAVNCDCCEKPLTYRTARRIGTVDLCEPCRAGLFEDHERAHALYPELF